MPTITDNELDIFNENTEHLENLRVDYDDLEDSYKKRTRQRNTFLGLAILFFLITCIFFLLKTFKPDLFISPSNLSKQGLTLLKIKDYESLKETKRLHELAVENSESEITEDEYTEDDSVNEKESIGDKIIYAVQIGAFKDNDIELYSDSFTQFNEFNEEGFYKYTLGAFETLEEARILREKVISIGFNDAFVASYANGERQAIEEAY